MEGRSLEDTIKYYDTRWGPFNLFLSWQFLYRTIAVLHYHRVCDIPRGIMPRRSELLRDNFLASSPPPTTSPFRGLPTQRGGDNSRNTNYRKILFFSISSREGRGGWKLSGYRLPTSEALPRIEFSRSELHRTALKLMVTLWNSIKTVDKSPTTDPLNSPV